MFDFFSDLFLRESDVEDEPEIYENENSIMTQTILKDGKIKEVVNKNTVEAEFQLPGEQIFSPNFSETVLLNKYFEDDEKVENEANISIFSLDIEMQPSTISTSTTKQTIESDHYLPSEEELSNTPIIIIPDTALETNPTQDEKEVDIVMEATHDQYSTPVQNETEIESDSYVFTDFDVYAEVQNIQDGDKPAIDNLQDTELDAVIAAAMDDDEHQIDSIVSLFEVGKKRQISELYFDGEVKNIADEQQCENANYSERNSSEVERNNKNKIYVDYSDLRGPDVYLRKTDDGWFAIKGCDFALKNDFEIKVTEVNTK